MALTERPEDAEPIWSQYGECPKCGAKPGKACGGLGPHPGRPYSATPTGAMMTAVLADLGEIDIKSVPGGRTYQAVALRLAETIDSRGSDDGPSVTAKLAEQLTKVMQQLTRRGDGDGPDPFDQWAADASTPVAG